MSNIILSIIANLINLIIDNYQPIFAVFLLASITGLVREYNELGGK